MVKILRVDTVVIFFLHRFCAQGQIPGNKIMFSSIIVKRDIDEKNTIPVSSCGDHSAKPARWTSKHSMDSDKLDLDTGCIFFFFRK